MQWLLWLYVSVCYLCYGVFQSALHISSVMFLVVNDLRVEYVFTTDDVWILLWGHSCELCRVRACPTTLRNMLLIHMYLLLLYHELCVTYVVAVVVAVVLFMVVN